MANKTARQKLEDKLTKLGVLFSPENTDAELQTLLDQDNEDGDQEEDVFGDVDEVTLVAAGNVNAGPARGYKRTFSKAQHGEDFKKHAKAWKDRFNAEVVQ